MLSLVEQSPDGATGLTRQMNFDSLIGFLDLHGISSQTDNNGTRSNLVAYTGLFILICYVFV